MRRLPLVVSCLALLVSMFAAHMAYRTRRDVQDFVHNMPRLTGRP